MTDQEIEYKSLVNAHTSLVWQKYWIEIKMIKLESILLTINPKMWKPNVFMRLSLWLIRRIQND